MTVSKEIADKVRIYERAKEAADGLFAELNEYFREPMDHAWLKDFHLVDRPNGEEQPEGEFCDQWTGYAEDDYHGFYYYPAENGKYVAIEYSM